MQFSSSLCPFWGCMMLLLRNLTTTASLCPWAPVQPVGRIQPCPLRCCSGRAPGSFGQGSSPLPQCACMAGRQAGCEGECGGRALVSSMLECCAGVPGDSALRALGFRDGCCLWGLQPFPSFSRVFPPLTTALCPLSPLPHPLQQNLSEQALFLLRITLRSHHSCFPAWSLSSCEFHPSHFDTHRAQS